MCFDVAQVRAALMVYSIRVVGRDFCLSNSFLHLAVIPESVPRSTQDSSDSTDLEGTSDQAKVRLTVVSDESYLEAF